VYALERRGRGESEDAPGYAIEREFEDVAAVVEAIGGPVNLLGHSYGAICALEAARRAANLHRLVLYEPPIVTAPIASLEDVERLEALLAAGDRPGVLITFMRDIVRMPAHELELFMASPAFPARVAAAHTLPREVRAQRTYRFRPELFADVRVPTCLLLGGSSPEYFHAATELVAAALPDSQVVVLPNQQHIAMDTAPEMWLAEVLGFMRDGK
jgi:pimeloyl-ACP methyl ester carboxylesterase